VADQPAADNGAAALTARYEQLRQVALTGNAQGWRHGLGVLTTRGVTGWMHTCRTIPPPPPPVAPRRGAPNPIAGDAATTEIVAVMAAMALAHL
jgi:hypothetical protein